MFRKKEIPNYYKLQKLEYIYPIHLLHLCWAILGHMTCNFTFFFFNRFNFIYFFWLRWVFVAAHRLSLVVESGG